jgi:hypothetical protein
MNMTGTKDLWPRKKMNRRRETGTALAITLMILLIVTVIGMAALMTSSLDLKITGNEQVYKKAFYAADAGLNYMQYNVDFVSKIPNPGATGTPQNFTMAAITSDNDRKAFNDSAIDFGGTITYFDKGPVPEGPVPSGTDFQAYHFAVDCTGNGPNQARAQLELYGYIVGYK